MYKFNSLDLSIQVSHNERSNEYLVRDLAGQSLGCIMYFGGGEWIYRSEDELYYGNQLYSISLVLKMLNEVVEYDILT